MSEEWDKKENRKEQFMDTWMEAVKNMGEYFKKPDEPQRVVSSIVLPKQTRLDWLHWRMPVFRDLAVIIAIVVWVVKVLR